MPRPVRRVEIYLPLEYNDGRSIADSKYLGLQTELRARFGGVTSTQRQFPLQGAWHFGEDVYEERVVVFTLMDFRDETVDDLLKYLARLKQRLKKKFDQLEILITVQELMAV
ncbi:MAG: hypothetical protein HY290_19240 [Planctomycetia bacterium]|nr:hypothetical protein [Planctomycetia bacterium]